MVAPSTPQTTPALESKKEPTPSREIRGFKFYFYAPEGKKNRRFWPVIDDAVRQVGLPKEEIGLLITDATGKDAAWVQSKIEWYCKVWLNRGEFVFDGDRLVKKS